VVGVALPVGLAPVGATISYLPVPLSTIQYIMYKRGSTLKKQFFYSFGTRLGGPLKEAYGAQINCCSAVCDLLRRSG